MSRTWTRRSAAFVLSVVLLVVTTALAPVETAAQEQPESQPDVQVTAAAAGQVEAVPESQAEVASDAVEEISAAEKHFRQGVELYNKELYTEALSEFNRALALDSDYADARMISS